MDYRVNSITGVNGYILYYNLIANSITSTNIEIGIDFKHNVLNKLKISMIVMDN
jgi:hypothetical protein